METLSDPWRPRSADWLARAPSEFAGRADRPLILGGCPRSGTTLLRAILDNHPQIAIPAESNFALPLWHRRTQFGDLREEANRRRVAAWIFSGAKGGGKVRGGTPRDEAIDRLAAAGPSVGEILAACFALYAQRTGKERWGDKRPRYAVLIRAVFDLWPDAQFVNIVRDPRAAVASMIPMGWDAPEVALPASTANWLQSVEQVDRFAAKLRPDQLLDVRYEDLVREPEREVDRVCAFAGLTGGEVAVAAVAAPRHGKRFTPDQHHRVARRVKPTRIDAWRDRISPGDAALVEHATARYFERFGYVRMHEGTAVDRRALRELRRQHLARRLRLRRIAARELVRRFMPPAGLEPARFGLKGRCSTN